jgi:uncharacterized membrane protein
MYLIYLFLTISLILVNIAGLTAFASRFFPAQASARLLGIALLTLIIFAFEHLLGLGKLIWVWPLTTALSVISIVNYQNTRFWKGELVFILGFFYGLTWRFAFPDIDAGTEHITDLYFISNFMDGETLPVKDRWLAGSSFDFYYAFQHYAAALLARIFNLDVGLTMNLSWALLLGLMTSLGWEISGRFIKHYAFRVLLLFALISGGNGLSPLMPFMIATAATDIDSLQTQAITNVWANTRFSGMYEEQINTPFGKLVAGNPKDPAFAEHLELPLETIAYYSVLGDYHPPLGGFIISLWTLALTAFLGVRRATPKSPSDAIAFFAIALTPALILVTNAWVFPLQVILVSGWVVMRSWKANINWPALLMGGITGFVLIYPFLGYFANNSLNPAIRLVPEHDHSPLKILFSIQWPFFVWLAVALTVARRSAWAGWLALSLLVIFCLSEFVFVDDVMDGKYQRFNTTLKWWSWLWPTALIGLASVSIGFGGRLIKCLVSLSLIALLVYTLDIGRYWLYIDKPHLGKLSGNAWLKQDSTQGEMLSYLKNAPEGLVMESIEEGAFTTSSALSLFANKPLLLGWPDHEMQWRGNPAYLANLTADIRAFYKAKLSDPLGFLDKYPVQTIIWTLQDENRKPRVRQKIQKSISPHYEWRSFYQNGKEAVGMWERRL